MRRVDLFDGLIHMGTMKWVRHVVLVLGASAAAFGIGCGPKEKPITDLQRKEAAHLVTEVDFAVTLRDYPRAESVMTKVVELVPDNGGYWITLGSVRKRAGNTGGAKEAYQRALRAFEAQAKKDATDVDAWLKQIYVLALLGRADDARSLSDKMAKQFPGNRSVRIFIEEKQFDQMLADPGFKEMAL
jgi:Flp pilus assembly protein TadD